MYEKLRKLNLKRRFSLRAALMASLTLALLVSATVFMTVSASDDVTPTDMADATEAAEAAEATDAAEVTEAADVSPTSFPSGRHTTGHSVSRSEKVSPTDVSASDNVVFAGGAFSKDTGVDPAILGDPVITMTSDRESCYIYDGEIWVLGRNVMIDYGDGVLIEYEGSDHTIKGANIKIYGDNITYLNCTACALTSLNVSRATELTELTCMNNPGITSLDVSNNIALTELDCYGCDDITSLDVSKNTALTCLICDHLYLDSLDVSHNTELIRLECNDCHLDSLDVSNNTKLRVLSCYGADDRNLTALDVTKNTALTCLSCGGNNLTSLDVSKNTALTYLGCWGNSLTSLDLSANVALTDLYCGYNQLSSLDLSNNPALSHVECNSNAMPFSGFIGFTGYDEFTFAPQSEYQIPSSVAVGESIDLSSEYSYNGTVSQFTWYDEEGNVIVPATANGGVFTFGEDAAGKTLVCKMTNAKLPDFKADADEIVGWDDENQQDIYGKVDHRLTTTPVTVLAPLGDPVITMTTSLPVGHVIPEYSSWDNDVFEVSGGYVFIDYGDGNIVSFPGDRTVRGSVIKIYGHVTDLDCWKCELNTLDVSKCSDLVYLDCSHNNLTSLDVSQNANLLYLQCYNNQLTKLDVSKNADLINLACHYNPLKTIDVSKNANLEGLGCAGTQITSLDVSKNTKLTGLWCYDNQLTTLDLTHNPDLTIINCGDNQLTSLDVTKQSALEDLYFDSNRITSIDLSKNIALNILVCNNNLLTTLDISNNTNLAYLHSHNNYLTFATINNCNPDNIDSMEYCEYAPQTHRLPASVKAGETVDLSGEYSAGGTVSQFTWYDADGNVVNPATANNGKFTFGEDAVGKTLICKMTNAKLPLFDENAEVIVDWNNETDSPIFETRDNRLVTTKIKILAADSTEPTDPEEEETEDNNGNGKVTPYYDLPFEQNEDIDDVTAVKYPEGTVVDVDGRVRNLHSLRGIQLTVGNIETNKKKSVLDAIKHYNETFDTETTDIALYDISLEDKNNVHVKVVAGEVLVCLKYPDNLARQSEDYVFHLYHQKADGTIEEIPVTIRRNGIWFRATDFSPYVLYWHVKTVESAGTGESFALIIVMTVLCALSVAGAGYALYRRKKLTAE